MNARDQFERDGFLIARGMFTADEMADFISEVQKAEPLKRGPDHLDAGTMRFYHNVFVNSPLIRRFITQQRLIDFLRPVIGPDFWLRWDQAVEKGPHSGVFPWHQDNGYSGLLDPHFQLWIALSEMTEQNGGLWLVPGSHHRLRRHRKVNNHLAAEGSDDFDAPAAEKTFIAAERGDVVLFSSYTLHKTYENVTERPRWAYVAEFLPTDCYDPTAYRPYFIAARDGRSAAAFVDGFRGSRDPRQRLRYLPLQLRHYVRQQQRRLRARLTG